MSEMTYTSRQQEQAADEKESKSEKHKSDESSTSVRRCPASYLPLNVMSRWAFGGFSTEELETRLKGRVKDSTLIASACQEMRSLLWKFAYSVSVQSFSNSSVP
jgi:hypothetical protein